VLQIKVVSVPAWDKAMPTAPKKILSIVGCGNLPRSPIRIKGKTGA
jgi:hypothetical protein